MRRFALIAVVAFGLLSRPVLATAVAAPPLSDEEVRFRSTFGLDTSQTVVGALSSRSVDAYGVRLTPAEKADIDLRFQQQDQLDAATAWVQAHATEFGGMWLDQTATKGDGFVVVVSAVSGARSSTIQGALALIPKDVKVRVEGATWSLAHLQEVSTRVAATVASVGEEVGFVSLMIDEARNQVRLGLSGAGPTSSLLAIDPSVRIDAQPRLKTTVCMSTESIRCTFTPYRGGLQLVDWDLNYFCSSGFWVKKASTYYFLTAAHCWRSSLNTDVWRYSFDTGLGYWVNDSIPGPGMSCSGSTCDANSEAAYLHVNLAEIPPTGRNVIYKSSTDTTFQITGQKSYANVLQGNAVCKSGITTLYTCGTVTGKGPATIIGGTGPRYGGLNLHLLLLIFTSVHVNDGDSGGPVFGGPTAYGLVTAKDGNSNGVMSSISYALSDMGLSLCVTTSC